MNTIFERCWEAVIPPLADTTTITSNREGTGKWFLQSDHDDFVYFEFWEEDEDMD